MLKQYTPSKQAMIQALKDIAKESECLIHYNSLFCNKQNKAERLTNNLKFILDVDSTIEMLPIF